ncbi:rhomboid-related protein 4-like isoform X2 [Podarcis raffonei]|uniref:rhomboid-related protein 4-like isoform X2 n=1 Tax=Podarcis raffonei TaxID=65483 RepID=UPI0023293BAD|nr:rhomboid-related protein 4-like isoform X2 [Podarcis raffonei]
MVPWATLALVGMNLALFWHPLHAPGAACLSVRTVWDRGQWQRLFLAPFHHLGPAHLLMNMATLLWLGHGVEQEVGSLRTGVLLLALALLGGLFHLALNTLLAALTGNLWYREHCAVGFSGVLFSLEAMGRQVESVPVATMSSGFTVTTRWLCILECLLLAILYPRSSLTGHVSGILAGLALSAVPLN